MRGYAICTEPRSGSTFLCSALSSTGELGRPTEFFNPVTVRLVVGVDDYPEDPEQQLALIPKLGATPNGVYGLKIFSREFDAVKSTRWVERLPSLSLIYLERLDLLGQAISHVRAIQTGQWASVASSETEPAFDGEAIAAELMRLARAQARWRYFFARNGLPFLHFFYEQIIAGPQEAIQAIAQWVGVSPAPRLDLTSIDKLKIQRDALSEDWRAQFLARARALGEFN
jgi:LPS sulfotransferase NodH